MKKFRLSIYVFASIFAFFTLSNWVYAKEVNTTTYINPLYKDIITSADLLPSCNVPVPKMDLSSAFDGNEDVIAYRTDPDQIATDIIKSAMVNRIKDVEVLYMSPESEDYYASFANGIAGYLFSDKIFEHTGVPTEGDYLRWQYAGWTANSRCSYDEEKDMYLYDVVYSITYYTDSYQESLVDSAIDSFVTQNITSTLTDYEKVSAIYKYICDNVAYSNNGNDFLKYTCYGAFNNHSAVCQGYSLLFYRMALECGIDTRMIASLNHGWNIVKLDDVYYNLDTTWDAGKSPAEYKWFLKSNSTFENNVIGGKSDHIRLTEFNNSDFNSKYVMSIQDYDQTGVVSPTPSPSVNPLVDENAEIVSFDMAQILRLSYTNRPDYSQVIQDLPETCVVALADGSSASIPIEWECLGEYDSFPQYFYYEFDIKTDSLPCRLSADAIVPYAGLFIGSGNLTVDSVTGKTNEILIANFLMAEMGCNNATTAGILANIYSESSFNTAAYVIDTNGKPSYGICQWNGSRFDSLKNYCSNHGYNYTTLYGQLNYLRHELLNVSPYNSRWNTYIKQSDNSSSAAYTAGYEWAARFEVCATRYREGRARLARDTYWPEYAGYNLNGLISLSNGSVVLYNNGYRNYSYNGLYYDNNIGWAFLQNGAVDYGYNDLYCDSNLGWRKIANGTIDTGYNDLFCSSKNGWWKIKDGMLDIGYNDLYCSPTIGWWKITNGTIDVHYNDLYCSPTLGWWKVKNGAVDTSFNDLYFSPTMGWWKITNGAVDTSYSDLYFSPTMGWWKIINGTVDYYYTDIYFSPTIGWWKIVNGLIDFNYNDMYFSPTMGWWKIKDGYVDVFFSDLYCAPSVGWWKITNGSIDFYYTDLYYSPTYGWWKIKDGTVDFYYDDLYCSPTIGWRKVKNGFVDFTYDDLYCSPTIGWWKVRNGGIDFEYDDVYGSHTVGWWKVKNGCIDFEYEGLFNSPTLGPVKIKNGTLNM